jgi:hypothetical protein
MMVTDLSRFQNPETIASTVFLKSKHLSFCSRFFFGKNKVMAIALGRGIEDEYRDNLHRLSRNLRGEKGLLFTNRSKEEVLEQVFCEMGSAQI